MDFIERIFGVSPDGGDGTTELMIIGAVLIVVVVLAWLRRAKKRVPRF